MATLFFLVVVAVVVAGFVSAAQNGQRSYDNRKMLNDELKIRRAERRNRSS